MSRRLMLGCADPVIVERVRSVAAELGDELVRVTTSSGETIDVVAAMTPDVLIVADSLGPVPVLDLIRQVTRENPFTGVLLLSEVADHERFRVAMEAGARSIAPMTFTVDDLGQRIDTAANWGRILRAHVTDQAAQSHGTGQMIVFVGSKGGVGTTTLAVQVALHAAQSGRRTCLIDLDLQSGDVATLLDITHRRDIVDLVAVAGEVTGQSLDDALYRHSSGLQVLLAPREGERGEDVTERVARAILGAVKSRFDVVVVDAGSQLTTAGAAAVEIADRAIIVITPDVLSARNARSTAQLWDRLQLRRESDTETVLNRASRKVEIQPDLAARLVKLPMVDVHVPAGFRALEGATNTGDPGRLTDRAMRRALARLSEALGVGASGLPRPATSGAPTVPESHRAVVSPAPRYDAPAHGSAVPGYAVPGHAVPGHAVPGHAVPGHTWPVPDGPVPDGHGLPMGVVPDSRRMRWTGRRDGGQTAVEFMGMVPIILLFCLALFQGGLIGFSHIVAGHAATRAARVAVSPLATDVDVRDAAIKELPSAWRNEALITVGPRQLDPDAQVTVSVRTPAVFPFLGDLFGGALRASSSSQLRYEAGSA